MKKKLMITGASGFIGTNFIEKYKDEFNIIPVCLIENKPEDLDYTGVDCILHLAALVHQMSGTPEKKYFEINTELTERLANKAKEAGVGHFVFYSTIAVYGTHGSVDKEIVLNVNSPTNPKDAYGKSKLEAEEILKGLENIDFKVSIIRPPMVYGENCPGNMTKLEKLVKTFPILPFGNNEFKRSIVHIDKLLEETKKVIDNSKNGIFIPKDEKDVSIREIVENLAKKNNRKICLIKVPKIVLKLMYKIKPRIVNSLYGNLCFGEKKRKICFISTVDYGIKFFMINHFKELEKYFDIFVITNTNNTDFLKERGVNAQVINFPFVRTISIYEDIKSLIKLIKILKKIKFSSIHTITPKGGLIGLLAGKIVGVPTRIHTFTGQVWAVKKGFMKLLLKKMDCITASNSTNILVDSNSQLKFLQDEGVLKKEATVLGEGSICGVDTNRFKKNFNIREKLRNEFNILDDEVVFGFVGRLTKDKGIYDLVSALKLIDDSKIKLIIIGPDEEKLYKKIEGERIIYLGYKENPEYFMNMMDIFCLPSYREGFGNVILEAASMEIPSIASNIYGLSDAVENNFTGLLHKVSDINDIANKMIYLKNNQKTREIFGQNARKRVEEKFSIEVSTELLVNYYNKIL